MKKNDTALNILVPRSLYDILQQTAERKCISLAALVRMACVDWLGANEIEVQTEFVEPTDFSDFG